MLTHEPDRRVQRGRPPGQELVVQPRALRLHDLAFLRAVANGLAARKSAERYLPELQADGRVVQSYLRRVAREACHHLVGIGEQLKADAVVRATQVDAPQWDEPDVPRPTLEEFREQVGDFFSEDELIQMFKEEYGEHAVEPPVLAPVDPVTSRMALEGLALLQLNGAVTPAPSDAVSMWLSPRTCRQLMPFGVLKLRDVSTFINREGRTWWRTVPGMGRERAGRITRWLEDHREFLGSTLSMRVIGQGHAPVQTEPSWPTRSLRSAAANALGAQNDSEAVQTWLKTLTLKSPNTLAAYRRDVERLLLWAHERGRGLATLTVGDAIDHAHFLLAPPAHWVNRLPAARTATDWAPMRGPLSVSSANRALAAIGHFYRFLVDSGYLVANPFAGVRSVPGTMSAQTRIDTTRAFGKAHIEAMQDTLQGMQETAAKRRLVALLAFAESTGLRRMELTGHTWSELKHPPDDEGMWVLRVVGKGNRERMVPIRPSVVQALERHRADRQALVASGVIADVPDDQAPLLSVLEAGPVGRQQSDIGHLSAAGLHRVLKQFFRTVARQCAAHTAQSFELASCHWLRHTFAHEVLKASGNDLTVTQQLLDHKNLSTTGLYLKADLSSRIAAVRALPERYAP